MLLMKALSFDRLTQLFFVTKLSYQKKKLALGMGFEKLKKKIAIFLKPFIPKNPWS